MKGMTAQILKHGGKSCDHLGNFSSKVDDVTIVSVEGKGIPPLTEPDIKHPAVAIVTRMIGGAPYLTAYPCDAEGKPDTLGRMASGSFIYSHDSRFSSISKYPIPLHDRKERW